MAIEHALQILNWHENLQDEDIPPEYLWEDPLGLEQWWQAVKDKKEDGVATEGRSSKRHNAEEEDGDARRGLSQNAYAQHFK